MIVEDATVVAATRDWVEAVVIGLNFCPFARPVFEANAIRYAVSDATTADALNGDLTRELLKLTTAPRTEIETTLLIHPYVLQVFTDYNDFLDEAEMILRSLNLEGVVQIASFHPQYQFAGTQPEDAENATNRSPYPMLHLLREVSVTEINDEARVAAIPRRNVALLKRLGWSAIPERFQQ